MTRIQVGGMCVDAFAHQPAPHQVVKAPTDSELTTRANGTSDTVDWQKQLDCEVNRTFVS